MPNNPEEIEFDNFLGIFYLVRSPLLGMAFHLPATHTVAGCLVYAQLAHSHRSAGRNLHRRPHSADRSQRSQTGQRGALRIFFSPATASPVYKAGTRMIKRAAGASGDVVLIDENENITSNADISRGSQNNKSCISVPPATDLS